MAQRDYRKNNLPDMFLSAIVYPKGDPNLPIHLLIRHRKCNIEMNAHFDSADPVPGRAGRSPVTPADDLLHRHVTGIREHVECAHEHGSRFSVSTSSLDTERVSGSAARLAFAVLPLGIDTSVSRCGRGAGRTGGPDARCCPVLQRCCRAPPGSAAARRRRYTRFSSSRRLHSASPFEFKNALSIFEYYAARASVNRRPANRCLNWRRDRRQPRIGAGVSQS